MKLPELGAGTSQRSTPERPSSTRMVVSPWAITTSRIPSPSTSARRSFWVPHRWVDEGTCQSVRGAA
nr:hypothetical protein [Deltaproteobacteria bacterium]